MTGAEAVAQTTGTTPVPHRPILYSFRRCPYAMRARFALDASRISCELREVVLRDKPPELLAASAKATVPVLLAPGGRVIDESLDIMQWALRQNDPGRWLCPQRGSPDDMLQLVARFDEGFKPHLDRYKYPGRFPGENVQEHRAQCAVYLDELNTLLCDSAFLCGGHTSLADFAIAPLVRQFAHTDAPWFGVQAWPQLQAWLAGWEASAAFSRVMHKYAPWRSGTPGAPFPPAA